MFLLVLNADKLYQGKDILTHFVLLRLSASSTLKVMNVDVIILSKDFAVMSPQSALSLKFNCASKEKNNSERQGLRYSSCDSLKAFIFSRKSCTSESALINRSDCLFKNRQPKFDDKALASAVLEKMIGILKTLLSFKSYMMVDLTQL